MTRREILIAALELAFPGNIATADLARVVDACRAALPDVEVEEAVTAAAQIEREQG